MVPVRGLNIGTNTAFLGGIELQIFDFKSCEHERCVFSDPNRRASVMR